MAATAPKYKDYYKTLGVAKGASEKEIKAAYRKLARKHHPDVNPGDAASEATFKDVQEAYDVLGDPDKRGKYDRFGDQWKAYSQNGAGGFPGGGANGGFPQGYRMEYSGDPADLGDMSDLFASLFGEQFAAAQGRSRGGASPFGNMRQQPQPVRGQDMEAGLTISLEEAYAGAAKSLNLSGGGTGDKRVEVKIPAGIASGQKVRVAGQGLPGAGGSGDLFLVVQVAPHPIFERKGDDLFAEVSVPFYDAALGGEVKVPTPKGTKLTMRLPAGVQSGQSLRLGGQGMPRLKGEGNGDLFARVKITVPKTLGDRERELLTELKQSAEGAPA